MRIQSDRSYPSRCAGLTPSSASVSITASAIARTCREFVPEQMTKKSVNPAALRRSSTTRFTAFLLSAAITARSICEGRRTADIERFSVLAMQPACRVLRGEVRRAAPGCLRDVKSMLLNVLLHERGHEIGDRFPRLPFR